MVGGRVIDIRHDGDRIRIWCVDTWDASGHHRNQIYDECGIYIAADGECPELGDWVWWQGRIAYWTPYDRRFVDKKLVKIGNSSSHSDMLSDVRPMYED